MAIIRPGRCYTPINKKPYTRVSQKRPRKSYVKGVPASKIHHFEVGKNGDYRLNYALAPKLSVQIRSNSLEAARTIASKYLAKKLGDTGFFLKILVYPHHVLRENPMATGAGADRYSQGMRRSFGKPIGQAARVNSGQNIILVKAPAGSEAVVKEALRRASAKLPGQCRSVALNPTL